MSKDELIATQCQGKHPFESKSVARQVAKKRANLETYKCRFCGAWHIGTKPWSKK